MGTSSSSSGGGRSSGWRENMREFANGTLKSGVWAALRMGRDEILAALLKVRSREGLASSDEILKASSLNLTLLRGTRAMMRHS